MVNDCHWLSSFGTMRNLSSPQSHAGAFKVGRSSNAVNEAKAVPAPTEFAVSVNINVIVGRAIWISTAKRTYRLKVRENPVRRSNRVRMEDDAMTLICVPVDREQTKWNSSPVDTSVDSMTSFSKSRAQIWISNHSIRARKSDF